MRFPPFGIASLTICLLLKGYDSSTPLHAAEADSPHVPQGYRLIWNDEFNGRTLDPRKWQYRLLGKRESAVIAKECVSLDGNGQLHLTTHKVNDVIHTGMIGTQGLFQQRYGYFEARIKFQKMQGHHGAFWLQSPTYGKVIDDPGQSGAEIDIIEFFGSGRSDRGARVNVYWNPYKPKPKQAKPERIDLDPILSSPGAELSDDFHIYALTWTDKEYVFSIDGRKIYRTADGLSHQPEYVVLSLLCSDWERMRLDDSRLPEGMSVDYVRVYAPTRR